ncbi:MAG: hypothetical protein ACOC1G_08875, partial [Phycisphaeraceae bacterium]
MRTYKRKFRDEATLRQNVKRTAERQGMNADRLAKAAGIDAQAADAILRGDTRPVKSALTRAATALDVKPTYRDAERYSVDFFDERNDLVRSVTGYRDRRASEELGRRLEKLSARAASRQELDRDLREWLEGLPADMQAKLCRWGLIDGQRSASLRPLRDHLDDFIADTVARGCTEKTAGIYRVRLEKLLDLAGIVYFADLTPDRVRAGIAKLGTKHRPAKAETRNHYVVTVKTFTRWLVSTGRADRFPLDNLKKQRVTDNTRRRAATVNEL